MAEDKMHPGQALLMILAKKKKDEMGKDEDKSDDRAAMAHSAMDDFIEAVHAKDCDAALAAWDDLCDLHKSDDGEGEEDEEEEHEEY